MNYMICDKSVYDKIGTEYEFACEEEFYAQTIESFLQELLFMDGSTFLYENERIGTSSFFIWAKGCKALVERHKSKKNCLYIKRLFLDVLEEKFIHKLPYLYAMPGEWSIASWKYVADISYDDEAYVQDEIPELIGHMPKRGALKRFEKEWRQQDSYNQILNEESDQIELDSVTQVKKIKLLNGDVIVTLVKGNNCFDTNKDVEYRGALDEIRLGVPNLVNRAGTVLTFSEVDSESQNRLLENVKQKDSATVKIINAGTRQRLRRQKVALEKLYNEKTVNTRLKTLLMDDISDMVNDTSSVDRNRIRQYLNRFGENVVQKEAFIQAVGESDIYMIQGPPGTGKTTVISELVNYIVSNGDNVLISSETHVAVDNVLERIQMKDNCFPVRLGKDEKASQENQKYLLNSSVYILLSHIKSKVIDNYERYEGVEFMTDLLKKELKNEIESLEKQSSVLKERLGLERFSKYELKRILSYQEAVSRGSELFEEIKILESEYQTVNQEETKLRDILHRFEIRQQLIDESLMNCEDNPSFYSEKKERELQEVKSMILLYQQKLSKCQSQPYKKTLDEKKDALLKKSRRLNRDKIFINRKQKDKEISIREYLYKIQNGVSEILWLDEQKREKEDKFEMSLEKLMKEFKYHKKLLDQTEDIRKEWLECLETEAVASYFSDLYIDMANIICATCSGIASNENERFQEKEYDYVIVDEAAKCNTLDLLIPLTMGKKIILVGDHKQLTPFIEQRRQNKEEDMHLIESIKENTLFKKLYEERVPHSCKSMLNIQYRMDEMIGQFVSETFYENKLRNGCGKRAHGIRGIKESMLWINCIDSCERNKNKTFVNEAEAKLTMKLLDSLDNALNHKKTVGVISLYKGQVFELEKMLSEKKYQWLEVENNTVDAFQGKEKQIIILNLVRDKGISDFMKDRNRINVAISRAEELLMIVSNERLANNGDIGVLRELYNYLEGQNAIYNENIYRVIH